MFVPGRWAEVFTLPLPEVCPSYVPFLGGSFIHSLVVNRLLIIPVLLESQGGCKVNVSKQRQI